MSGPFVQVLVLGSKIAVIGGPWMPTVRPPAEKIRPSGRMVWPPQKIGPGMLMRTVVLVTGFQIAVTPSSPNISTLPLLSSAMWTAVIALGGVNGVPQTPVSTLAALAREGPCDANEAATTASPAMIAISGPRGSLRIAVPFHQDEPTEHTRPS